MAVVLLLDFGVGLLDLFLIMPLTLVWCVDVVPRLLLTVNFDWCWGVVMLMMLCLLLLLVIGCCCRLLL